MLLLSEYETITEYRKQYRTIDLDGKIVGSLRRKGLLDNCPCGLDTCIARTPITKCGGRALKRYERYHEQKNT